MRRALLRSMQQVMNLQRVEWGIPIPPGTLQEQVRSERSKSMGAKLKDSLVFRVQLEKAYHAGAISSQEMEQLGKALQPTPPWRMGPPPQSTPITKFGQCCPGPSTFGPSISGPPILSPGQPCPGASSSSGLHHGQPCPGQFGQHQPAAQPIPQPPSPPPIHEPAPQTAMSFPRPKHPPSGMHIPTTAQPNLTRPCYMPVHPPAGPQPAPKPAGQLCPTVLGTASWTVTPEVPGSRAKHFKAPPPGV